MSEILFPSIAANIDGRDQVTNLISSELTQNRTIFLNGEINDMMALNILTQLHYLDSRSDDDIILYINSPGGSVTSGMVIYDAMTHGIRCDICTVAAGIAASMGALLLAAGTKGKRYALPNADVMLHQPLGGAHGQATDITLVAAHIQRTKKKIAAILAHSCGKAPETVLQDTERDNWKSPSEALEYGLIDHIGFPNQNKGGEYE